VSGQLTALTAEFRYMKFSKCACHNLSLGSFKIHPSHPIIINKFI